MYIPVLKEGGSNHTPLIPPVIRVVLLHSDYRADRTRIQFFHCIFTGLAGQAPRNSEEILQAVGAVGAIIMPHNLYLHSALVKTRQ